MASRFWFPRGGAGGQFFWGHLMVNWYRWMPCLFIHWRYPRYMMAVHLDRNLVSFMGPKRYLGLRLRRPFVEYFRRGE